MWRGNHLRASDCNKLRDPTGAAACACRNRDAELRSCGWRNHFSLDRRSGCYSQRRRERALWVRQRRRRVRERATHDRGHRARSRARPRPASHHLRRHPRASVKTRSALCVSVSLHWSCHGFVLVGEAEPLTHVPKFVRLRHREYIPPQRAEIAYATLLFCGGSGGKAAAAASEGASPG